MMPQMKPMNWMILFILTNFLMMMINMLIFFSKKMKYIEIKKKMKKNLLWKW